MDRGASWRQGFKSLTRLKLTQAEWKTSIFFHQQVISKHFSQFIYIVYILFISYKMHLVELPTVKRFIVVEVCIPAVDPTRGAFPKSIFSQLWSQVPSLPA